jgi:prefoldin subunit 5
MSGAVSPRDDKLKKLKKKVRELERKIEMLSQEILKIRKEYQKKSDNFNGDLW